MGRQFGIGAGAVLALGSAALLSAGCASATHAPAGQPAARPDDEVVQVGYGTMTRRQSGGSVGSLVLTREEAAQSSNMAELLNARIPGVDVWRTPGGDYSVRIRGGGDALVVVDGMVPPIGVSSGMLLSLINPADVERIDVLKDAGSAAIYGVRGGNGVMLITTRRGPSR